MKLKGEKYEGKDSNRLTWVIVNSTVNRQQHQNDGNPGNKGKWNEVMSRCWKWLEESAL